MIKIPLHWICGLLLLSSSAWPQDKMPVPKYEKATFAAGCFWCIEPPFDKTGGVKETIVGYSGGKAEDAAYDKVSKGITKHLEVIQVTYDPKQVTYAELVEVFWKNIDPYNDKGQFCDKGNQYRSAIFFHNEKQRNIAEQSKQRLNKNPNHQGMGNVKTDIIQYKAFYPAEDYHQNYYTKNPVRYKFYRFSCGRDKRLKQIWGRAKPLL